MLVKHSCLWLILLRNIRIYLLKIRRNRWPKEDCGKDRQYPLKWTFKKSLIFETRWITGLGVYHLVCLDWKLPSEGICSVTWREWGLCYLQYMIPESLRAWQHCHDINYKLCSIGKVRKFLVNISGTMLPEWHCSQCVLAATIWPYNIST